MRTSNDVHQAISDLVEHQEIAEGRVIHGHNMTFHAPVFGELVSDGGMICFESSFGWGSAVNPAGQTKAKQRAFNATFQSPGGVVELESAESCLIIGRHVTVQEAVKCQIFAHTLRIGRATGCLIAGRDVEIRQARPYKQEQNVITMVVPDIPDLETVLSPQLVEISEQTARVEQLTNRINALKADAPLAQYLTIRAKVRAGMIKLTEAQNKGLMEMAERMEESAKALEGAVAERNSVAKALAATTSQVQALRDAQRVRLADCRCNIARVDGETLVRQLLQAHHDPDLSLLPLPMIPKILFRNDGSLKFLCAVTEGKVAWSAS